MFMVDKKQIIIVGFIICSITFGAGYKTALVRENNSNQPKITVSEASQSEKPKPRTIAVHVTGAVKNPGVYLFNEGARVVDAVNKAGQTKEAECTYINLAEVMRDQQQIFVPKKGENSVPVKSLSAGGQSISGNSHGQDGKININTASAQNLDRLPGIGPSFAQRIVDYRNQHGGFKNVSDLLKVSGIGEKKYAQIKDRVTVQ